MLTVKLFRNQNMHIEDADSVEVWQTSAPIVILLTNGRRRSFRIRHEIPAEGGTHPIEAYFERAIVENEAGHQVTEVIAGSS